MARIGNSSKATDGYKIDVRGHGGFAVGEGSRHASGADYVGNGLLFAELPQEVADLLLAGQTQQQQQPDWQNVATGDPNTTMIPFHERHEALVKYAGRLHGKGLDYGEAVPTFHTRWLLCEQPDGEIPEAQFHTATCPYPVTWDEAEAKLADVFGRYAAGNGQAQTSANSSNTAVDKPLPDGLRPTDVGNAARLIRHAGQQLRYVHAWGKWLVYIDGRWILDEKDALVTELAKGVSDGAVHSSRHQLRCDTR